jgi:hypothetical protein
MTTMTDEQFARLRTYRNNIHRYRILLSTPLSDLERQFIKRRLSEELHEMETLSASTFPASLGALRERQQSPDVA